MISCSVYGCSNNSLVTDQFISFHPFPKSNISEQWIQACGWQEHPIDVETAHICSSHFEQNAYDTEVKVVDYNVCFAKVLKGNAIPTLNLPQTHIIIKESPLESIVVYTISQGDIEETENITIELQGDTKDDDVLELQPSSSLQTYYSPEKNDRIVCDRKTYNVKTQLDLSLLQAHNKSLKKHIERVQEQVDALEEVCREKEALYKKIGEQYKQIQTEVANTKLNNTMKTQQDQKMILSKVFSQSQIKMLFGKKKVAWSDDDMAVGYTIRHLSNKRCYLYLTKKLNIPLPAISSIKRWVRVTTKKTKKPN